MREFARTEVIREKCHWCGCKNKLFTNLVREDGNIVGHVLRCCNCGRTDTFINPGLQDEIKRFLNGKLFPGSQKCIQESFCPHKQCSLYGTCGGNRKPPKEKSKDHDVNNNKLSNRTELMFKIKEKPKFK